MPLFHPKQGFHAALFAIATLAALAGCAGRRGDEGLATGLQRPQVGLAAPILHRPVTVSSRFGEPRGDRIHKGIDLQAPAGTPVHATAPGRVTYSGEQRGYGEVIIIEHGGGLATVYAHLRKRRADAGDEVRRGQHIGDVGRSGNATTDHLHYEVRVNGAPVDPAPYLPR